MQHDGSAAADNIAADVRRPRVFRTTAISTIHSKAIIMAAAAAAGNNSTALLADSDARH